MLAKSLVEGARIALITPSHQISPVVKHQAILRMQNLGFQIVYHPQLRRYGYFAGTVQERVQELHDAFNNDSIDAIFVIRGGSGILTLLNQINYDVIAANPKIIMGLSDVTALLLAIYKKTGLITFHGPVASTPWPDYTICNVRNVLFKGTPYIIEPHIVQDTGTIPSTNIYTLHPGTAKGRLIGGNLTLLTSLLGTPYQPEWDNAILFLEDVNEEVYAIDRMLSQLELAGCFERIKGIIFGNFKDCQNRIVGGFYLEDVLERYIYRYKIPAFIGAAIGHNIPQIVCPIGCLAEINAESGCIKLLEASVK